MPYDDLPYLIRPRELERLTGLKMQIWAKLRCHGGGPPFYRIGGRIYYDPDLVMNWLEHNKSTQSRKAKPKQ